MHYLRVKRKVPEDRQDVCTDSGGSHFPGTIQVAGQAEEASIGLLLLVGAGEGGGDAEGDEHSSGDVALGARPARVSLQRVRKGAGEERPDTVAQDTHDGEEQPEEHNLARHSSAGSVHKLWEEGKEKQSRLWIEHIHDDALPEDAAQSDSDGLLRWNDGFFAQYFLYAQVDQVRRAQILHCAEGKSRRHQQRRQT